MVNHRGQTLSEFMLVMLALLAFGILLTYKLRGGQDGAAYKVQQNASTVIAND
jgi:uncharacterized protein (UPF0333 family)